jgi:hypothetical protein
MEWQSVYPTEKLAVVMPSNIVINIDGGVKLVTKYSFVNQ